MNSLSGDELQTVFQLCQPNESGLISLSKLQKLFEQHKTGNTASSESISEKVSDCNKIQILKFSLTLSLCNINKITPFELLCLQKFHV